MMETLDVRGLPEPIVRALEVVVQMARNLARTNSSKQQRVELSVWKGNVVGRLTRREIYDDRV